MIDDPNPYSRNLFIVATAFMLYAFLGLEKVSNTELNFLMNSFIMEHPGRLSLLAWAALFWFWLSFWIHTYGQFTLRFKAFYDEYWQLITLKTLDYKFGQKLWARSLKKSPEYRSSYKNWRADVCEFDDPSEYHEAFKIRSAEVTNFGFSHLNLSMSLSRNRRFDEHNTFEVLLLLSKLETMFLFPRSMFRFFMRDSAILTYVMPNIFFIFAVASGVFVLLRG